MRLKFTIAKNACANVMRGGASAVVALALPHFLTKSLSVDRFAAWALMLQVAAYANYLDFGLQTAVARYLAGAIERGDEEERDRLVSTAFGLLACAGILAIGGLGVVIWKLPALFRTLPATLTTDLRLGLIILAASAAAQLPLSTFTGVLIGLQRNEFPAVAIGGSRLLGAIAVILVARRSESLAVLALCIAICNFLGAISQYIVAQRLLPSMRLRFAAITRQTCSELIRYCSALTVWSFSMLLVSGLDVTIVGLFNFEAVGYYSIATTLIAFVSGLNNSAFNAMMAPVAVLQARNQYDRISELVISTTRLASYGNIVLTVVVFLFGKKLLVFWVGQEYASAAFPILCLLVLGQTIRLSGNAYATALVATGLQRYGVACALTEGILNLILSVAGMALVGAAGVAWATLIAAAVALAVLIAMVMPRAGIAISARRFVSQGFFRPSVTVVPVVLWLLCRGWLLQQIRLPHFSETVLSLFALSGTLLLAFRGIASMNSLKVKDA